MKLDNEFEVPRPVEEAWAVLTDVERIAPCLPGAQLTEVDGDVYHGFVKVKVGPVTAQYAGQARFTELDAERHHVVLEAKGKEKTGKGLANALVTADLHGNGDSTRVTVSTDLTISGPLAQFGRGAIAEVSAKLLNQFVTNLRETVLDAPQTAPASTATTAPAAAASTPPEAPAASSASDAPAPPVSDSPASPAADAAAGTSPAAATTPGGRPGTRPGTPQAGYQDAASAAAEVAPAADAAGPQGAAAGVPPAADAADSQGAAAGAAPAAGSQPDTGTVQPSTRRVITGPEAQAVDMLSVARGTILKRLIPLVIVLAVVAVVLIVWLA